MHQLLNDLLAVLQSQSPCVLCTLIETRGSTPQKAGAAMLVLPDGSQRGTLGGGCVEAEVKQKALRALASGQSELATFHLDDNYGWDDGLICGGRMEVLTQPLLVNGASGLVLAYFQRFQQLVVSGQGCTEALLLRACGSASAGARFLFNGSAELLATLPAAAPPEHIVQRLAPLHERPKPYTREGVAYLPIPPRIRLLIVGGGHVGQAVGQLAAQADFDVWVLDDREAFANRERFPAAQRLVVGAIGEQLKLLCQEHVTPSTYALIVTRGHNHDEEALYHLAGSAAGYVGMIGSKRKIRLIFDDLLAKGIPREALARVHAPLGLDIGSQTVPEIAVSIVAELIAHRNLGNVPAGMRRPSLLATKTP